MKNPLTSKTIVVGLLVTLTSVATIFAQAWQLLGPDEVRAVKEIFGPELTGVIGLLMIVLRVATTVPLTWRGSNDDA